MTLQLRKAALRQKIAQEKIGNDTEAICGTMGFAKGTSLCEFLAWLSGTGIYKWTLLWNHEPTRKGLADGVEQHTHSSVSNSHVRVL